MDLLCPIMGPLAASWEDVFKSQVPKFLQKFAQNAQAGVHQFHDGMC